MENLAVDQGWDRLARALPVSGGCVVSSAAPALRYAVSAPYWSSRVGKWFVNIVDRETEALVGMVCDDSGTAARARAAAVCVQFQREGRA